MSLQVQIMTPDRIFLKEEAEEIILPTNTGQIGILKNHAPIITALDIGVMLMRSNSNNEWIPLALMGGFALIKQNQVTVLVNEAESSETIDPQQAETEFIAAKEKLENADGPKAKVEANFAFKRERARYQVIKQAKKI